MPLTFFRISAWFNRASSMAVLWSAFYPGIKGGVCEAGRGWQVLLNDFAVFCGRRRKVRYSECMSKKRVESRLGYA